MRWRNTTKMLAKLAYLLTQWSMTLHYKRHRFVVTSGGGPGIMEAANRGASEAGGKTIGLNIRLPFEQAPNPYITPSLSLDFHYFFMRKFWFAYLAKALVVFPGGFGTLDEMFELLTLTQTRKLAKEMTIVVYGSQYWNEIINLDTLVKKGTIISRGCKAAPFRGHSRRRFCDFERLAGVESSWWKESPKQELWRNCWTRSRKCRCVRKSRRRGHNCGGICLRNKENPMERWNIFSFVIRNRRRNFRRGATMEIREMFLPEFDQEMKKTRAILERVPEGKPDFKPHEKSMALGKLAAHTAQLPEFAVMIAELPELDFSKSSMKPLVMESRQQLLDAFDANAEKARAAIAKAFGRANGRRSGSSAFKGTPLLTRRDS